MQVAMPGEITGLAFNNQSNRLAMTNRNSVVQLYNVDSAMALLVIFSVTINDFVPSSVSFTASEGAVHNVMVFGLYDGNM